MSEVTHPAADDCLKMEKKILQHLILRCHWAGCRQSCSKGFSREFLRVCVSTWKHILCPASTSDRLQTAHKYTDTQEDWMSCFHWSEGEIKLIAVCCSCIKQHSKTLASDLCCCVLVLCICMWIQFILSCGSSKNNKSVITPRIALWPRTLVLIGQMFGELSFDCRVMESNLVRLKKECHSYAILKTTTSWARVRNQGAQFNSPSWTI